jgi:hypothetical protein
MQVESAPSHTGLIATADATYQAFGVEPNPTLNANITWSSFNGSWTNPLEYQSGENQSDTSILNAGMSNYYANPISINPADIQSNALQKEIAGGNWTYINSWILNGAETITNTSDSITFSLALNSTATQTFDPYMNINTVNLPSGNLAYDYWTIAGYFTTTSAVTNMLYPQILYFNATTQTTSGPLYQNETTSSTGTGWSAQSGTTPFYVSLNMTTSLREATAEQLHINVALPKGSGTDSITITGMAITGAPLSLGTYNGKPATASDGNALLQKLNPSFAYTRITGNGYTVAVSQPMQNITTSQTSINNGIYTEQVTYQGIESLPSAPDLSYTNSNITMPMKISGKQFQVANLNGVSYLSEVQAKSNGTFSFGSVNPNSQNSIILEVEYTANQWNSVSAPPSFWTEPVQAIEYYWYIALGVLLGAIGLGSWAGSKSDSLRGVKK